MTRSEQLAAARKAFADQFSVKGLEPPVTAVQRWVASLEEADGRDPMRPLVIPLAGNVTGWANRLRIERSNARVAMQRMVGLGIVGWAAVELLLAERARQAGFSDD